MRKVGLSAAAGLMLLAASGVSVLGVSASGSPAIPSPLAHSAGPRSHQTAGPALGPRVSASTASTPICDGAFHVVASPNGTGNNVLQSNTVINANDAWAVGTTSATSTSSRTLAEHWNGTSWSIKATANPDTRHNRLLSVSAVSSNDIWAVGYYDINATNLHDLATLAEHWNGTSWSKVTTVNPTVGALFLGVTTIATNDVWAVGQYFNFGTFSWNTLTEHYNGSTWSVVPSANSSTLDYNELDTISAFSSTDIWAVGLHAPVNGDGSLGTFQSLAEHWDGISWTVVSTPNTATGDNAIVGVNALEANHAVGVGSGNFVNGSAPEQAEAWNLTLGGSTNVVLNASPSDNGFESVARSGDGVWAVGFASANTSSPLQAMVWQANWNTGTHTLTWAASPGASDSPSSTFNFLTGVAAVSPSVFWAVGTEDTNTNVDQTLTEVYCGLHFTVSAPGTAVPGTPFSVTVTAKNADSSTATDYLGTIHFTSSDSLATLPGNYTFTPGDAGTHTFSGVVLRRLGNQSITASDTLTPFETGSTTVSVACVGACPSPAGTPGSRAVLPGPSGVPGTRVPIRPRTPATQHPAAAGGHVTRAAHPAGSVAGTSAGVNGPLSVANLNMIKSAPSIRTTQIALAEKAPEAVVAARGVAAQRAADSPAGIEVAVSLWVVLLALVAIRRRRSGEEVNFHD